MTPSYLWEFLPAGYLTTILIETPVLLLVLSRIHPIRRRLFAGIWLTACTYPIVVLVIPLVLPAAEQRWLYLLVAEIFAPAAECVLFSIGFHRGIERANRLRDWAAIIIANLASFGFGELMNRTGG